MRLPFLDRERERERLLRAFGRRDDAVLCVYGRRRLGKSRLLREVVAGRSAVYFLGDERDAPVVREALAREIDALVPGFSSVRYPGWPELLDRFHREAPRGAVLVLDELPSLVASSPELPSVLRTIADRGGSRGHKTVLCGSSQRMMHGLVLDGAAPLYGRAEEIVRLEPLPLAALVEAFRPREPAMAVERWAVWGGVPRYWELALDYPTHEEAFREVVLDPQGPLHREPERLLHDELDTVARAVSVLSLIGQGAHRLSEIAGRIGQPATSLSRPLARLCDLGFVTREVPFGSPARDAKRSIYVLGDPFLRFWYRFVEPNLSKLEAGHLDEVVATVLASLGQHLGSVWEELARKSASRLSIQGRRFGVASRWWGRGLDGASLEIDLIAEDRRDPSTVLVGEAKARVSRRELPRVLAELEARARNCPAIAGRRIVLAVWALRGGASGEAVLGPADVIGAAEESGHDPSPRRG